MASDLYGSTFVVKSLGWLPDPEDNNLGQATEVEVHINTYDGSEGAPILALHVEGVTEYIADEERYLTQASAGVELGIEDAEALAQRLLSVAQDARLEMSQGLHSYDPSQSGPRQGMVK